MTTQYTHPSVVAPYPGAPRTGEVPLLPPMPPMQQQVPPGYPPAQPPRKSKGGLITAAIVGAAAIALTAGAIGGLIGNHMATAPTAAAPAAPPAPTAEQVHVATVDLCTRFAAGDRAMPSPQNTGFDVIPSYNYIAEALRDNPAADNAIRDAVGESLKLARDQAAHFSNTPAKGAIQPANGWTVDAANAADQRVWDLCKAYGG
ncbi:hypothetical protein [Mycolicibacterium sphagni]|uniref:DUF732 domain-containing protein n=1 Tax=Mycolicibacterium sphagni TaxID=1786 RepID=A0ABX2K2V1_9MYCO|nr:hypothetical protein [Mycolicibacterium sphagni]NTY62057.1 hypothetical protein [Mycolicibacterium sphagni]